MTTMLKLGVRLGLGQTRRGDLRLRCDTVEKEDNIQAESGSTSRSATSVAREEDF